MAALLILRSYRLTVHDMWYDAVGDSIFSRASARGLEWNPSSSRCAGCSFNVYALIVLLTPGATLADCALDTSGKEFAQIIVITALALNWTYLLLHWR